MQSTAKNLTDYLLTDKIRVGDLQLWLKNKSAVDKAQIIGLIKHRIENRYLKHVRGTKSGFLIMSVSCLAIEMLQSFKEGRRNTNGKSELMFSNFFGDEKLHFPEFEGIAGDFFKHVRCGILHQAETTDAWRIVRVGKILDTTGRTINADAFLASLTKSLDAYILQLTHSPFDSKVWLNAILKLEDIIDNCRR